MPRNNSFLHLEFRTNTTVILTDCERAMRSELERKNPEILSLAI
jgi:hypothetical protein